MPTFILEESNYAGPIPEDAIVKCKVTGVKVVKSPFKDDDGNEKMQVEFAFQVDDPSSPYDGQRLWGNTPTTFVTNPNCKLRNWSQEILATEFPSGFALDTDALVGNHCRAVVSMYTYEKNGEEKTGNRVKDVIRAAGGNAFASADDEPF